MTERNLCKEAGCQASCCRGSYFQFGYPVKKVLEWFPEAQQVGWYQLPDQRAQGVYYERNIFGNARVRIVGNCPNLGPDNNCLIYESRPPDCADLGIGSKDCSDFRRHYPGRAAQTIPVHEIQVFTQDSSE